MKEFEIVVEYDEESEAVNIRDYHYNSCTYCKIKSTDEIGECIKDFIKSYYEGNE